MHSSSFIGGVTRRDCLKGMAALAAPIIIPSYVFGDEQTPGANDRIEIGLIGVGIRGKCLIGDMPGNGRLVALCDCYLPRIDEAKKPDPTSDHADRLQRFAEHDATSCATYQDYRRMIDDAKLDAVVITTPDHHHVQAAMLACEAGLDVYCEKPLTLTIGEGKQLVNAVRHRKRILQVGSQQRSMEMDRFACQFVRNGGIGKVSKVEVKNWPGPLAGENLPKEAIPERLDWNLFCGPRPFRPYNWRLWMKDVQQWQGQNWRGWDMWRDYSGHLMTNHGAHAIDIVQWALGKDNTGPVEIEPLTDNHIGEMRTCPVIMRYADGTELQMTHEKGFYAGGRFYGEHGEMVISRNQFNATPGDLIKQSPAPAVAEIWKGKTIVAGPHLQNWLDCIRSRKDPVAPVEVGQRSVTICHLAGIARELGRKLRWDPVTETFPDDSKAQSLVDRPRRKGWELPNIV